MRKGIKLIVTICLLFFVQGCSNKFKINKLEDTKQVSIFYGASSYALFSDDKNIIDNVVKLFNDLEFKKSEKEIDIFTMLKINFALNDNTNITYSVDKNNVFWIDGTAQSYEISSGEFNYEKIYDIYENSKTKETNLDTNDNDFVKIEYLADNIGQPISEEEFQALKENIKKELIENYKTKDTIADSIVDFIEFYEIKVEQLKTRYSSEFETDWRCITNANLIMWKADKYFGVIKIISPNFFLYEPEKSNVEVIDKQNMNVYADIFNKKTVYEKSELIEMNMFVSGIKIHSKINNNSNYANYSSTIKITTD